MKVGELKKGMLVRPIENWEIVGCDWPVFTFNHRGRIGKREDRGVIGVTCTHAWNRKAKESIMMYVETTQDDFQWGGVKRHHRFLWNGRGMIMAGYDMRYLEPVDGE